MAKRGKYRGKATAKPDAGRPASGEANPDTGASLRYPVNPLDREHLVQVFGAWVTKAEAEAREEKFKEWAAGILTARDSPPAPTLLSVVRRPTGWFIPLDGHGRDEVIGASVGAFASIDGMDPAKGEDRPRDGQSLLPLYDVSPDRPARQIAGGDVPSLLGPSVDGLLVHVQGHEPRLVGTRHLRAMTAIAAALDLEDMLLNPAEGQADRLLQSTWYPIVKDRKTLRFAFNGPERRVQVFTFPAKDCLTTGQHFQPMDGRTFFAAVAAEDHDGIEVNGPDGFIGRDTPERNCVLLGPGFAVRIGDGLDIRPGAAPLAARNRDEVGLWLRFADFPDSWMIAPSYQLVDVPDAGGRSLTRAYFNKSSAWTPVETLFDKRHGRPEVWSPVFDVGQEPAGDGGIGPGTTRILCAGLMAQKLQKDAHLGFGRDLPFITYVPAASRASAASQLRLAVELRKLIPDGEDRLPHAAILTVRGAEFLRHHPECAQRTCIDQREDFLRRHMKRFVWRR